MWFTNWFKKNANLSNGEDVELPISNNHTNIPLLENANILKKMEMVCHNLNTPLATLEIVATLIQHKVKPEEHELLIAAIKRIREISDQLN